MIRAALLLLVVASAFHTADGAHTESANWSIHESEIDALPFSSRWGEALLNLRQQYLCRWLKDRVFLGLRLFWHVRKKSLLGFAALFFAASLANHDFESNPGHIGNILGYCCVSIILHGISLFWNSGVLLFAACRNVHGFHLGSSIPRKLFPYVHALLLLGIYLTLAMCCGAVFGHCGPCFCKSVFLWTQSSFDATLGFPGEGPCSLCGEAGHNFRTCPHVPSDTVNVASFERNTFVDIREPAQSRARSLRRNLSDGDDSSAQDLSQLSDVPPSQLRRINEDGDAVPGSQDSELAAQAQSLSLSSGQHAASSGTTATRVYCPVPGCIAVDPMRSPGWSSVSNMRAHLGEHACGRLIGDIPQDFLEQQGLNQCTVCSRLLSRRYGSACPRCRPTANNTVGSTQQQGRPPLPNCPDAQTVASTRVGMKKGIPKGARKLWATCLLAALANVASYNDVRAWTDLLSLPTLVLCAEARGGRKHQRRIEANTKQKCQRWIEGERDSLWRQACKVKLNSGLTTADDSKARKHGRASELLQDNLMHKACSALSHEPPVHVNDLILEELRSKHPLPRDEDLSQMPFLRPVSPNAATTISTDDVFNAIASFSRSTGAGPFGLRPLYLKDSLVPGLQDEVLRHVAMVLNIMAQGRAPRELQHLICGASLTALPKPDGTHRPIACGNTWRRLCAKCLSLESRDTVTDYLYPLQLGVGVASGTEAIVHVTRQWLHRFRHDTSRVLVTIDIENAFNSVDRSAILRHIRRVMPSLAPWADYCYSEPSTLFVDGNTIVSGRGIQQGDPLGPSFFAICMQDAIQRAKEAAEAACPGGLDWTAFYLDDGTVTGSYVAVSAFVLRFEQEVANLGMTISTTKCELVPAAGHNTSVPGDMFAGFQRKVDGDFKLLGAPFGSQSFINAHTAKRVGKAAKLLEDIADYPDHQGALLLIRQCCSWCKVVYSSRVVPPSLHMQALSSFSDMLKNALEHRLNYTLDEAQWAQAGLNIASGGIGLRDPCKHASAAYLASTSATRELCTIIDPQFEEDDASQGLAVSATRNDLVASVPDGALVSSVSNSQKCLSKLIDASSKQQMLAQAANRGAFKSHIALCELPGAGAWLTAPPCQDGRAIDAPLYRVALRRRLRVPVFSQEGPCPCCGEPLDIWGDHCLSCCCAGDRVVRHNDVRNVVYQECRAAGLRTEKEKAGLLPPRARDEGMPPCRSARRPADVWQLQGPSGSSEAWDFTVGSGLSPHLLELSARSPEEVVSILEERKRLHLDTSRLCAESGFLFCPMVLEAHGGGWSVAFRKAMEWVSVTASSIGSENQTTVSLRAAQRISCSLQKENARAVLRRTVEPPGDVGDSVAQVAEVVDASTWQ